MRSTAMHMPPTYRIAMVMSGIQDNYFTISCSQNLVYTIGCWCLNKPVVLSKFKSKTAAMLMSTRTAATPS